VAPFDDDPLQCLVGGREGGREGGRKGYEYGEKVELKEENEGHRGRGREGGREGGRAYFHGGEVFLGLEGLGGRVVLDVLLGVDT